MKSILGVAVLLSAMPVGTARADYFFCFANGSDSKRAYFTPVLKNNETTTRNQSAFAGQLAREGAEVVNPGCLADTNQAEVTSSREALIQGLRLGGF